LVRIGQNILEMKKYIFILNIILGFFLVSYFFFRSNESFNNIDNQNGLLTLKQKEIIFNYLKDFPNKTQMSIAFIREDSCWFYGAIKQNDTVSEIDNKFSNFEIGSITKLFTATLLADFILDSTITLTGKINNDLDFRINNDIQISYLELANHTSGLPRRPSDFYLTAMKSPLNPYKAYNKEKLEKYLKEKLVLNQPGELTYEYSNLGFGILGYTLCQIAQCDYETLLKKKIFDKYGLTNTTSIKENISGELVQGLGPFGNPIWNENWGSLEACAGLISSVHDLTKFAQAQFDSNHLELALTRESTLVVDSTLEVGLAWHIMKAKSENDWHRHNGGTFGYRSSLVIDIENKTGIIVLSNVSVGNPNKFSIDDLSFELMKTINAH